MKALFRFLIVAVIAGAAVSCIPKLKDADGQPTTEQNVLAEGKALIQHWKEQVAILEAKPNLSPEEQGQLAKYQGYLDEADFYMADVTTPEGGIDEAAVVRGASSLLPFPFNLLVGAGVAGGLEWWRNRNKRTSFVRLIDTLNRLKKDDPAFAEALHNNTAVIRAELGPTANRLIDRVRDGHNLPAF